jgi:hypothetical protein
MSEDPKTEELRIGQEERERAEGEQAAAAEGDEETAAHARRADKAAYLKSKLEQRGEAERTAERDSDSD